MRNRRCNRRKAPRAKTIKPCTGRDFSLLVFHSLRSVCSATPEAEELKTVLTRLSGKNRKRGKPPTAGILLSGLFVSP
ncbi:MAG: hypothetical protein LBT05_09395 [Planctomycetaceae bacterium]|nr:hypothetical protein [Planctomycetaceae bacterium]